MKILEVCDVAKSYRSYKSELHRILGWFGIKVAPVSEKCTLKDVSFTLSAGETLGIIGVNGAGKSTLLKIIAGTLCPSKGSVICDGRIAAILELGMGFSGDLSGRENAYYAAGAMGFSRAQIDSVIEEIKAFAEIGDYFEEPVRLYSSGMQVRVAFAVATAFRPDVLIIDEALSVGDDYFQHKSFARIRKYREEGMALLFVSHDRNAVLALCDRVILLDGGRLIKSGNPEETIDYYNALIAKKEESSIAQITLDNGRVQTISGSGEASVVSICLKNPNGENSEILSVGERACLHVVIEVKKEIPCLVFGYMIKDRLGQIAFGTNTWHTKQVLKSPELARYHFVVAFPINFGVGSYSIATSLSPSRTHLDENYEWRELALTFEVVNPNQKFFIGTTWSEPKISWEKL